jgi:hypothetical protein
MAIRHVWLITPESPRFAITIIGIGSENQLAPLDGVSTRSRKLATLRSDASLACFCPEILTFSPGLLPGFE